MTSKSWTSLARVAVAQALVFVTAWLSVAPALHGSDDPDCNPAVIIHDSSQHRVTNTGAGADALPNADHCVACHFFRLSRTPGEWRFVPQGFDGYSLLRQIDATPDVARSTVPLPARAPPPQSLAA